MFARHFIDSLDFARNGNELRGEVAVADLPRLQDALAAPEGKISYAVRGLETREGRPALEIELNGSCQLRCQRCLEAMTHAVGQTERLLLVPEAELDAFSDDEGELDSIPADRDMDVLDLVEEEILLSLPFVPRHPEGECSSPAVAEQSGRNPFAALAGLKKK